MGRVPLYGSVSINGTPIKVGAISFLPLGSPKLVTSSGASVINGKYSVPTNKGVVPGEYRVEIYATGDVGDGTSRIRRLVPPKYNAESELTITVAKGKSYDFDLVVEEKDFKGQIFVE